MKRCSIVALNKSEAKRNITNVQKGCFLLKNKEKEPENFLKENATSTSI